MLSTEKTKELQLADGRYVTKDYLEQLIHNRKTRGGETGVDIGSALAELILQEAYVDVPDDWIIKIFNCHEYGPYHIAQLDGDIETIYWAYNDNGRFDVDRDGYDNWLPTALCTIVDMIKHPEDYKAFAENAKKKYFDYKVQDDHNEKCYFHIDKGWPYLSGLKQGYRVILNYQEKDGIFFISLNAPVPTETEVMDTIFRTVWPSIEEALKETFNSYSEYEVGEKIGYIYMGHKDKTPVSKEEFMLIWNLLKEVKFI